MLQSSAEHTRKRKHILLSMNLGKFSDSCRSPDLSIEDTMSSGIAWSIKNGDLDVVKSVINGTNVNELLDGRTPLHFAADYGQTDIIAFLLSRGADVNSRDQHGITPLLAAVWEGHVECVRLLLSKGAAKDGVAPDGSKYVDCAENKEIRQMLVA